MLLRRYHNVQQQKVKKQAEITQPAEKPVEVAGEITHPAEKPPVKRGRRKKVDIDE